MLKFATMLMQNGGKKRKERKEETKLKLHLVFPCVVIRVSFASYWRQRLRQIKLEAPVRLVAGKGVGGQEEAELLQSLRWGCCDGGEWSGANGREV